MLEISGIKKQYKQKKILQEISFQVKPGTCTGIIGGNGSGKTTLLSILAGASKADDGLIYYQGNDVTLKRKFYASEVAYVPQENPLIEELSVKDNLRLWYKDFNRLQTSSQIEEPYIMLGLVPFLKMPAGRLSGGMKKRLSIACALSNHASILILDEPGAALDLVCKAEIRDYLKHYQKQGGMIILTSHEMDELSLCSQMHVLRAGRLETVAAGLSASQLMAYLS